MFSVSEITFKCETCGSTAFALPDDPTDDSRISCSACGRDFCSFGELEGAAEKALLYRARRDTRDAFAGQLKSFNVK